MIQGAEISFQELRLRFEYQNKKCVFNDIMSFSSKSSISHFHL